MTKTDIDALVAEYRCLKSAKIFLASDQIRDELIGMGIEITEDGWRYRRWRVLAVASRVTGEKYERVPDVIPRYSGEATDASRR